MKMDLEVSEPLDFSSGDHPQLGRKAADNENDQSKAGPAHTHSTSVGSRKIPADPKPKTDEQLDAYMVQISDESSPAESATNVTNQFSDASVRRAFIRKVFLLLTVQLLATGAIMCVFVLWRALKVWILLNPWFTYALLPAFLIIFIVLACCEHIRHQVPTNYILLAIFTVLQGLLLGTLTVFYNANELFWAILSTAVVTFSLTIFALQTKLDFTLLNGVLFVSLIILLLYGIVLIFIRSYWLHALYAALGTILFSLYLVIDMQMMIGGKHHYYSLSPEEYVFAVLSIYLDIINIFIFILQLVGLGR
ncbi:protein lifeguard 2 [Echinops telfairi]|uniref:Protein lifeguard 2 n=1 Tax=Echinops telfairi TaxID=9371 RepID=A0ABM0ILK6_ECHTE|nr:protein lifeguard 2 [Echinops telfairi]